jgi:hypothetical protein
MREAGDGQQAAFELHAGRVDWQVQSGQTHINGKYGGICLITGLTQQP